MQRVMRRTGKKNFWDLYPNLPRETRNYVPTFTAIMYSMKYAQAHQLHSPELKYRYAEAIDTLQLNGRGLDLRRLSQACGFDDSLALHHYNPELRHPWLPAGYRSYAVQVPATARPQLALVDRATLFDYCQPRTDQPQMLAPIMPRLSGTEPFASRSMLAEGAPREQVEASVPRFRRIQHKVRRGETAASVANRYDVTTAQVNRWNGLRKGRTLTPGRQLVVFVPVAAPATRPTSAGSALAANSKPRIPAHLTSPVAKPNRGMVGSVATASEQEEPIATTKEPVQVARASAAATITPALEAVKAVENSVADDDSLPTEYVVRKGDYLSRIAEIRGLSVKQVMEWNKLKSSTVAPGQKLVFAAPTEEESVKEETPVPAPAPQKSVRAAQVAAKPQPVAQPAIKKVHLVQVGDTLYNISRRYQGVTVEQLKQLNHLTSDEVKPGQKLIVAR